MELLLCTPTLGFQHKPAGLADLAHPANHVVLGVTDEEVLPLWPHNVKDERLGQGAFGLKGQALVDLLARVQVNGALGFGGSLVFVVLEVNGTRVASEDEPSPLPSL